MHIGRKGKHPRELVCQGTCKICGTVVQFKQSEAKYNGDYDRQDI